MFRSPHLSGLSNNYLFQQIQDRVEKHPPGEETLISLGIGDTTHPLPTVVSKVLAAASSSMGDLNGYVGYGPTHGIELLRQKISDAIYDGKFSISEISISDGIKPDIARFALLTGGKQKVAVQDPAYPIYLESSQVVGSEVVLLPATADNGFCADWLSLKGPHLLFLCNPNNPTGVVLTRRKLQEIVDHANREGMIILYDGAYRAFVHDPKIPRSIFEMRGAENCAVEFGSFSKSAGFSGLRLGWCVVPKELRYNSGEQILPDWWRILSTTFNGPSYLSQVAGIASLSDEGQAEYQKIIADYRENGKLLRTALEKKGLRVHGGIHAPFLWVDFRPLKSWEVFDHLLANFNIVTTPGSGFGTAGEGFVRFSALGPRNELLQAIRRLKKLNLPGLKSDEIENMETNKIGPPHLHTSTTT